MKKSNIFSEDFIINNFLKKLHFNKKEAYDFNNDAGFINFNTKKQLIVTNDTIIESIDFFKNDPPESIAIKIVNCNLSDVSAMGALPYAYTLSLCLPKNVNYNWLTRFTKKLKFLQKKYNFFLVGGDLSKSNKIIISSNFFGYVNSGKILKRTGARINDDIWITGDLGESTIGLMIKQKKIKINTLDKKYFLKKYLFPNHCSFGEKISKYASSAIDISDGFYGDLNKMLNNNFGAILNFKSIPISKNLKKMINNNFVKLEEVLNWGDDYQLIFTSHSKFEKNIIKIAKEKKVKITKIGRITNKPGIYTDSLKLINSYRYYDHFA